MTDIKMTSMRPYLIRAVYNWIIDNNLTPYILVNADYPNLQLPKAHVKNGHIVLNVSPSACRGLHLNDDRILFTASFSGKPEQIVIFPGAVLEIYAKENGEGMMFDPEEPTTPGSPDGSHDSRPKKPHLTLVK